MSSNHQGPFKAGNVVIRTSDETCALRDLAKKAPNATTTNKAANHPSQRFFEAAFGICNAGRKVAEESITVTAKSSASSSIRATGGGRSQLSSLLDPLVIEVVRSKAMR
ncbi:MAG: hypothetical protein ACKVHP_15450, partial [Verrucomicrobiales bacterium]